MARGPFFKLPGRSSDSGGDGGSKAIDPLAGVPLFALVTPDLRARVRKKLANRPIGDGKPLFLTDEPSDSLYVVQSGRFRVFLKDRYGQERVLQFVGPGEVLGEAAFMADAPHVTSAEAVDPSRVWRLAREDFDALLGGEQPVMRYLAGVIAQRQAQANARIAQEATPDEVRPERGYVTALFSPRGGSGVTTLAVNLGLALAESFPDEVVLLDLDTLFGHASSYLWLTPKGALSQVPPGTLAQLDRRGLDYYLLVHESSMRVFQSALNPVDGEQVSPDHVRAAISVLRRNISHIIVDLPHNFSEAVLTTLELADRVLVLSTPELTSLRDTVETRRILHDVLELPEDRFRYLVNHPQPYEGVPTADFAAATGVPWDEISFGGDSPAACALRGESLYTSRPSNPISKASAKYAEIVAREGREVLALGGR
jgi:CRP-like cAMP-binding protein